MKINIGKNTLGDNDKMSLSLREYGRSTSDLSYAWRSTMGIGTLVPFMKILALPGDTFDIDLENKILTNPTIGPLFGSMKFQADVFTCPLRLYNAMLHNNALNIGMNMKEVKLPKYELNVSRDYEGDGEKNIAKSSIFPYLGTRAVYKGYKRQINAVPLLAVFDIFKNYYANKQEDDFLMYSGVKIQNTDLVLTGKVVEKQDPYTGAMKPFLEIVSNKKQSEFSRSTPIGIYDDKGLLYITRFSDLKINPLVDGTTETTWYIRGDKNNAIKLTINSVTDTLIQMPAGGDINNTVRSTNSTTTTFEQGESVRKLEKFKLEEIDNLREFILSKGKQQVILTKDSEIPFIKALLNEDTLKEELGGMLVKTHQSDLFNNWINSEWVEGSNGISAVTAIDTSSGSFTLDTLNLAKKVYEMLNRIAVSGGSYKDWIETVYTSDYYFRAETPVYEGGMSSEIEFEPIVSTSASQEDGYEPLGTLAGRGINNNKKGGKLTIKVNEPCYIIGLASITPRVDYGSGEDWDNYLDSLDDLHKPQMDGIGYQDLLTREIDSAGYGVKKAIGKQPAWIQYTTAVNKTYADFATGGSMSYMVLNKKGDITTAYINPEGYNNIFATTGIQERNFQVQIACGIEARRVKSAREIPTF